MNLLGPQICVNPLIFHWQFLCTLMFLVFIALIMLGNFLFCGLKRANHEYMNEDHMLIGVEI